MNAPRRLALVFAVVALSLGLDQATKRIAVEQLKPAPPSSYLGDLFRLQYAENAGSFLSLGAGLPDPVRFGLFVVGVGVFLFGLLGFLLFSRRLTPGTVVALSLVVGGGLGNWIDRVLNGRVVDFLNIGVGPVRTGVFNVADVLLYLGVALVLVPRLLAGRDPAEEASEPSGADARPVSDEDAPTQ